MSNFNTLFEKYTYLYSTKEEKALKTSIIRMHEIEYKYHKINGANGLSSQLKRKVIQERLLPQMQSNFIFYRNMMYGGISQFFETHYFDAIAYGLYNLIKFFVKGENNIEIDNEIDIFIKNILMLYFKDDNIKLFFDKAKSSDKDVIPIQKKIKSVINEYLNNKYFDKQKIYKLIRSILYDLVFAYDNPGEELLKIYKKNSSYVRYLTKQNYNKLNYFNKSQGFKTPRLLKKCYEYLKNTNLNSITSMAESLTLTLNVQHYSGFIIIDYLGYSKLQQIDKAFLDQLNVWPTTQWDRELKEEFGI
jgi:hypothetical protein